MKIFLLFIGLFFFADIQGANEVFSLENLVSNVTHEKIVVLHTIKLQGQSHALKHTLRAKFSNINIFAPRKILSSKIFVYFKLTDISKQFFDSGPQNLAIPPPFQS